MNTSNTKLFEKINAYFLIVVVLIFLTLVLVLPLVIIFIEAFRQGWSVYMAAHYDPDAVAAIKLTLLTAAIVLPINIIIGFSIAWLVSRFDFYGKTIVTLFLDLPFAISPVVAGLMLVLLFGNNSFIGELLANMNIQIVYAIPGIVLATLFVTFPFIARELIPIMQAQGKDEEQVAIVLGARPWHIFWHITLPNVKWALFYGIILSNARAMGEFGAVSVVSGHIRQQTNTLPLHIEILYNEYNFSSAFASASMLAFLAVITICLQNLLHWYQNKQLTQINLNNS